MGRHRFAPTDFMTGCFFQLLFGLLTVGLSLLIPALFTATVWLTGALLLMGSRMLGRTMHEGWVLVLTTILWSVLFLLIALPLLPTLIWFGVTAEVAMLTSGLLGGGWGLCVGYRLATMQQLMLWRTPDPDPARLFDQPTHFYRREETSQRERTVEDLFAEGIVLGERVDQERRR